MNKILNHPVIAAVVASLILSFLGWFSGVLPDIFLWLKKMGSSLVGFLTIPITLHLWVLVLISIPLLTLVFKYFRKHTNKTNSTKNDQVDYEPVKNQVEPKPISLTDEEVSTLKLLVQKDGAPAEYSDFKYQLRIPKLQAEQILESLTELGLVKVHYNYVYGTKIYLTKKGRDFVIGNKYART